MNDSAGTILVKPLVVMAARLLGPGPIRLRLVRLAHNLGYEASPSEEHAPAQPTQRAA